jgi:hypothetical protein
LSSVKRSRRQAFPWRPIRGRPTMTPNSSTRQQGDFAPCNNNITLAGVTTGTLEQFFARYHLRFRMFTGEDNIVNMTRMRHRSSDPQIKSTP